MKHFFILAALTTTIFTPSVFAADAGVSVSIGQPGFYGRLDVGDYSHPRVIYFQSRVVGWVERSRASLCACSSRLSQKLA